MGYFRPYLSQRPGHPGRGHLQHGAGLQGFQSARRLRAALDFPFLFHYFPPNSKVWGSVLEKRNARAGWVADGSELGACGPDGWHPPRPRERRSRTESAGPRHGERRGPTQRPPRSDTDSERVAGRDTESAGARHRECGRAPEPDTDSAEQRNRERRGPTQKVRKCRNPTQRAPGPDTESGERAPGRDPD